MALTAKQERFVERNRVHEARFWAKIDVCGDDECWPWLAAMDSRGYGRFHVGIDRNSSMLAHRVSFGLSTGEEPEAVCHRCDNPRCCNPKHLFGGTRADNNRDMKRKGRYAKIKPNLRGQKHHMAKLSDDDAVVIRNTYSEGGVTQYELAEQFGVCQRTISKIVRGLSFKNTLEAA